jgi:transcriptional regulator with XRE-family HTH domain
MTLEKQISDRIKEIIQKKRLSKSQFADLCQVQESIVTRWLSGRHNFTLFTICKIEAATGEQIITVPKSKVIEWVWTGKLDHTFHGSVCA